MVMLENQVHNKVINNKLVKSQNMVEL